MRIAFDLDGTLIPGPGSHMRVERLGWIARLISCEQIREGAPDLMRALQRQGHEVWIYTTSLRSSARLRLWFASFGVLLDGAINQTAHNAAMAGTSIVCSKYPPAFGIELLIDDAAGLLIEGERLGFPVMCISEGDSSWCSRVCGHLRGMPPASLVGKP
jgi:FMN phosphatase YigB (HAD superfamily)